MYLRYEDVENELVVASADSNILPKLLEPIYVYPITAKTESDCVKYIVQDFYRAYVPNDDGEFSEVIRVFVEKA